MTKKTTIIYIIFLKQMFWLKRDIAVTIIPNDYLK